MDSIHYEKYFAVRENGNSDAFGVNEQNCDSSTVNLLKILCLQRAALALQSSPPYLIPPPHTQGNNDLLR